MSTLTATPTTTGMLDFLMGELHAIRPSLPKALPLAARYHADLNLDSLDLVELVARIEQRYRLKVPDADLAHFRSLEATVQYLRERVPA